MPTTSAPLLGEPVPVVLINTIWADRAGVHDALSSDDETEAWLAAIAPRCDLSHEGCPDQSGAQHPEQLSDNVRTLRDALRRIAAELTQDTRVAAMSQTDDLTHAVEVLNAAAATTPRWTSLSWNPGSDPSRTVHADAPLPHALVSEIANDAVDLFAGPDRPLLRACLAPGCVLYFIKSHPRREWCSAACGNRARVARHYQRHAGSRA